MGALEELRRRRGLSRRRLAERVGVSQNAIWKWEREGQEPTVPHLRRLVEVLAPDQAELRALLGASGTAGKA